MSKESVLPFRIHPRAFRALGADLVTNDIVAVIELVKNAYDAYATKVDIRFRDLETDHPSMEIWDNGSGMSRSTIEEAWCVVATPYRREHRFAKRSGRAARRTSGEKGLGRLSAARLGDRMQLVTQTNQKESWRVDVDWIALAQADLLEACSATISANRESPFKGSGTIVRILDLRTEWDEDRLADLRENLARLVPPFDTDDNFTLTLSVDGSEEPVEIRSPDFLKHPKYMIKGEVDASGRAKYRYRYRSVDGEGGRTKQGTLDWGQVQESSEETSIKRREVPDCGPFTFEIRAWDTDAEGTREISERFGRRKSVIRQDIRAYKGISVYRDGILVLPKVESNRDWLGLDLRRVGKVGKRLSTPQIVGHVSISAEDNPKIEDTSDREKLASTPAVVAFQEILKAIVYALENERDQDRTKHKRQRRTVELFDQLSSRRLEEDISQIAEEGGGVEETLEVVREFSRRLEQARDEIETRFTYYSRLATIGTISQLLVHEVRNRTSIIGESLRAAIDYLIERPEVSDDDTVDQLKMGTEATFALARLADRFAPLASRAFGRRKRSADLREAIERALAMLEGDIRAKKIDVRIHVPADLTVAVDPGELDAVLLNLLNNAVYWVCKAEKSERHILVRAASFKSGKRVRVSVQDSGPGVSDDDLERVFWPGVTQKPGGIGMGLTVAAEIIYEHQGELGVARSSSLGGANFAFDVPIQQSKGQRS